LLEFDEVELTECDADMDEELLTMNPRELTLEKWSFLKSLYLEISSISFSKIVFSLGREFINELNLQLVNPKERYEHLIIKKLVH
jgi:hypothetical protein